MLLAATEGLIGANTNPVDPLGAEELIAELRRLRYRIPDYTQLKPGEFRSMVNASAPVQMACR